MKHLQITHYLVLIILLVAGVAAFYYVTPDTSLQLTVGVVTSVTYVLWGLMHHALNHDLHQKIVVEYILIGAIAIVLLATVIKPS